MRAMPINPLKPEHVEACNKLLKAIPETIAYLKECIDCGIDVADELKENQEQLAVVQAVKKRWAKGKA